MIVEQRADMWKGSMFIIESSSTVVINWAVRLQDAIVEANRTSAYQGISPGAPLEILNVVEVTREKDLIIHVADGYPQTKQANGET